MNQLRTITYHNAGFLSLALGLLLLLASPAKADSNVPMLAELTDLEADLAYIQEEQIPLMLFFHASYCGFCIKANEAYLEPMSEEERNQGEFIIRRVGVDFNDELLDANGETTRARTLARDLNARIVPNVIMFGPDGEQLGKSIVGINVEEFYYHYLQRAVRTAKSCIEDDTQARCHEEAGRNLFDL